MCVTGHVEHVFTVPLMPAKADAELTEHLPTEEAFCLKGHEGPVLAVRFNSTGTYCLSCGKVQGAASICIWLCHYSTNQCSCA